MSIDEQHVALPQLYGAPAYGRPTPTVAAVLRPFDPDDLPIEALMTEEDRAFAATLPARAWAPGGAIVDGAYIDGRSHDGRLEPPHGLMGRPLNLRSIAGRLIRQD